MRARRRARELALRVLYATELSQNSIPDIIDDLLMRRNSNEHLYDFCQCLIKKTHENCQEFDNVIKNKALNWDFNRIAIIDKIILIYLTQIST